MSHIPADRTEILTDTTLGTYNFTWLKGNILLIITVRQCPEKGFYEHGNHPPGFITGVSFLD
jgi:hypothetical protein